MSKIIFLFTYIVSKTVSTRKTRCETSQHKYRPFSNSLIAAEYPGQTSSLK